MISDSNVADAPQSTIHRQAPAVLKIGGSLLDSDDLFSHLEFFIKHNPARPLALVAGGGPPVDWIRQIQTIHRLDDDTCHHLALTAMRLSLAVAASKNPTHPILGTIAEIRAASRLHSALWVDAERFLHSDETEHPTDPMPHSWQSSSDSIAARLAARLGAPRLILWKSAPLHQPISRADAARRGLVDDHFPIAAHSIETVEYVNLRATKPAPVVLFP